MAVSKYQTIKQHLLDQIESGDWPEGHPVPSENQLAESFSVSRMTARRALQELADQGLIKRNQGAASVVASLKSQSSILEIKNIADEIADRGHRHKAQVLVASEQKAGMVFAAMLGLDRGDSYFETLICHWQDDSPIQLEQRYVNPKVVPEYLQQDFTQITPHEYLCQVAPLTEAEHRVEAVSADILAQQHLGLEAHAPCLRLHRTTWSKAGTVSYAVLTHPGDKFQLGGHLTFR
ncbi:Histidine utilization repressor [Saliniradius amylolyticus]|uniref:Histidine utilization repressor n=1 Tax=Saliniradius amylolyticus TaxID=2183582 RepID=A0A2S2DZ78_9ALTE|nr:histidine utilization repressor [Saliniradius amylolyticus]AWL10659.1 Histidine utilization repressor [Saliniradius amylolyticus]